MLDAEHRALGDGWVLVEHRLDLGRVDVLAAAQDQVAAAGAHEQPAVADGAEVAGAQPAVGVDTRPRSRVGSSQ